jgi:hypothetical protein
LSCKNPSLTHHSLADAKLAEDAVQDVVREDRAQNPAQVIEGLEEFQGDDFVSRRLASGL